MSEDSSLARVRQVILSLLKNNCEPKLPAEIAADTGIALSSVIRILDNLTDINWVVKVGDHCSVGTDLIAIGQAYITSLNNTLKEIRLKTIEVEQTAHTLVETDLKN